MEHAIDNGSPKATFKVRITLEQLQIIAKRVEHTLKLAKTGQEVLYQLTPCITLEFDSIKTETVHDLEMATVSSGVVREPHQHKVIQ
jgi:hypothetical protein